jgi:ArsR family transcriptional regulator
MKAEVGSIERATVTSAALFQSPGQSRSATENDRVVDGEVTRVWADHWPPKPTELIGDQAVLSVAAALADPTRYQILEFVCGCDNVTSQALCNLLDVSPATVSHHLRQLRLASLIESARDGRDGRIQHHRVRREVLNAYVGALSKIGT